jgi:hypothetical protein
MIMADTTANRLYPYPESSDNVRPYEDIQALADAVDVDVTAILAAWTAYTPAINGDSGTPTLGTGGTISGRYKQVGKTVTAQATFTLGTSAAISGAWYITLPVAARSTFEASGSLYIRDIAPGANYHGNCVILVSANTGRVAMYVGNAQVTAAVPHAWASGDRCTITITYEAA